MIKIKDYEVNKYIFIGDFSQGLAVVKNMSGLYGYINKDGIEVIPCRYTYAFDFKNNGIAKVVFKDSSCGHINTNGMRVIRRNHKLENNDYKFDKDKSGNITVFDKKGNIIKTFDKDIKEIKYCGCNMYLYKNSKDLYGYLNENFDIVFPAIYNEAYNFCDDVAVIKNDNDYSYLHKDGTLTIINNDKYTEFSNFNEGYAYLRNNDGLYVFIDKDGNILFNKKFKEVSHFSEGFAAVTDINNNHYYIDINGNKNIELISEYDSVIEYDNKYVTIKAKSEKEREEKKLEVLKKIKQIINYNIDYEMENIISNLYNEKCLKK